MAKVLFVYPNKEGYPIIPLGISVLSGILKNAGHSTDLFDVTFIMKNRLDNEAREKTGTVVKVDVDKYWGTGDDIDPEQGFIDKIKSFKPDLIAFSIVENTYLYAQQFFNLAKKHSNALVMVGGLFPTTGPEFFTDDANVDIICIGEGEYAIEELANKIDKGEDISNIKNLMVRKDNQWIKNELAPYYNWEPLVLQDWDIFDERHLYKPFMGKIFKTGFFELSRGCPNNCSYCINHLCQKVFKGLGNYNRAKPIDSAIYEMVQMKKKYNLELVFFNDENFLTMRPERFEEFIDKYQKNVNLPFFIMTRADSLLDKNKIKRLKDAGCVTIGIGVESGNEEIRKNLLNKKISNEAYEQAFKNCHEYDIRTTANIMIGLPFETEENILESAAFCKKLEARSLSLSIFAPYHGTKLRDICLENGFIEDKIYDEIAIINDSVLTMPQLSKEKIKELYYKFNELAQHEKSESKSKKEPEFQPCNSK